MQPNGFIHQFNNLMHCMMIIMVNNYCSLAFTVIFFMFFCVLYTNLWHNNHLTVFQKSLCKNSRNENNSNVFPHIGRHCFQRKFGRNCHHQLNKLRLNAIEVSRSWWHFRDTRSKHQESYKQKKNPKIYKHACLQFIH